MDVGLSALLPQGIGRRAGPLVGGGALAGSAVLIATHDPGTVGSRFPTCAFHHMSGLWCPACGLTRGTYQLLHGHIGAALSYNVFTPVAIFAIVAAWVLWLRASWGRPPVYIPSWCSRAVGVVVPTLLIVYGVLRNIPVAPLRSLAP